MFIYIRGDFMNVEYELYVKVIKALSDTNRMKIINLLSNGEKCACELLNYFDFTQPTLSHHMKVLSECGLVSSRKVGQWSHYTLNILNYNKLMLFFMKLVTETDDGILDQRHDPIIKIL